MIELNFDDIIFKYITNHKLNHEDEQYVQNNFPKIKELLDAMIKSGYQFDLKSNNIMMRGNVPVITDPLMDPSSF